MFVRPQFWCPCGGYVASGARGDCSRTCAPGPGSEFGQRPDRGLSSGGPTNSIVGAFTFFLFFYTFVSFPFMSPKHLPVEPPALLATWPWRAARGGARSVCIHNAGVPKGEDQTGDRDSPSLSPTGAGAVAAEPAGAQTPRFPSQLQSWAESLGPESRLVL